MANPKTRTNRSKRNMRRSHHALTPAALTKCKDCGASKRPHYACPKCK